MTILSTAIYLLFSLVKSAGMSKFMWCWISFSTRLVCTHPFFCIFLISVLESWRGILGNYAKCELSQPKKGQIHRNCGYCEHRVSVCPDRCQIFKRLVVGKSTDRF